MQTSRTLLAASLLLSLPLLGACGQGDAAAPSDPLLVERGRAAFAGCLACHDHRHRRNGVGPHLVNIIGRNAGAAREYPYSEALGRASVVWTPDALRRFLADPAGTLPGTNMVIDGLSPADAEAVVAYLLSRE